MGKQRVIKKKKTFSLPFSVTDYIENNSTSEGFTESELVAMIIREHIRRENYDYDNDQGGNRGI